MKTLFYITIKVTRPYGTVDDVKIYEDYAEIFERALRSVVKDEMDSLKIPGLDVKVKVK